MTAIIASLQNILFERLNRALSDHIYVNLVAEIPEPMLKQLAIDGFWEMVRFVYVFATLPPIIVYLIRDFGSAAAPFIQSSEIYAGLAFAAALVVWQWKWLRGPTESELNYRRQHGKWRWDH